MVEIIIVTHGDYGKALLESSQLIMGEQELVKTFGLHLGDSVDELREQVAGAIEGAAAGNEVLVLTDMMSGSPFNVAASLMERYPFHHVTGVNLPTFLEILGSREFSTGRELSEIALAQGKNTFVYVNQLMEGDV